MSKSYDQEKKVAVEAVKQASTLARQMQGQLAALDVVNKEDLSPVTITDFSVQALVNMHLMRAFENDPIMGEEDTLYLRNPQNELIKKKVVQQLEEIFPGIKEETILYAIDRGGYQGGAKGRFWVLDPIDGTRGFIRKESYAIALALVEEGEVVLGVLGCPRFDRAEIPHGALFTAIRGQGSIMTPYNTDKELSIRVQHSTQIIYCEPHMVSQSHSHTKAYEVATKIGAQPRPFRLDSQVKYAHVATGDAAIYLRIPSLTAEPEKIWDHAAGTLIVQEAGGLVTDVYGHPLDFSLGPTLAKNRGLVASNGYLHDKVLAAISDIGL